MKPLISVCILTYNRSGYIQKTIKSALLQNYKNIEVVVIDDKSPDDTEKVLKKLIKTDIRVKYIKNKNNLGLSKNFYSSFNHCKGEIVIFIGDDDIFVDNNAINEYVKAFKDSMIGIARARQIIFRNNTVRQAVAIDNKGQIKKYKKGKEAFSHFLFDCTSIAGLAYKIKYIDKDFLDNNISMYPQFELAGKLCAISNAVQINKYLVGVRSHDGQLNVLSYRLDNKKTNIIDDMSHIYDRLQENSKKNNTKISTKKEFLKHLLSFLPLFLPYNTMKNGKKSTFEFIKDMTNIDRNIWIKPLFLTSFLLLISPNFIIYYLLQYINKMKLKKILSDEDINNLNKTISTI